MENSRDLGNFQKQHDFFIGYDSDGCVFDSMEIKHKECFCPAVIKHYGLQVVSKYAREVWEFVNLYSKTRGCNRFLAVLRALSLLADRSESKARQAKIASLPVLRAWTEVETKLGNPTLIAKVEETQDEELKAVLAWSLEVNARIEDLVFGLPPFPLVTDVLDRAADRADQIVVSQTPIEALLREWAENGIDSSVQCIAGQEQGSKTEHLQIATGGSYDPTKVLMIGDAPGDYKAAKANNALFFPVIPGREEASWEQLLGEGLERFFGGGYAGAYQEQLLADFDQALPENPSW